jgi:hypothetical protein
LQLGLPKQRRLTVGSARADPHEPPLLYHHARRLRSSRLPRSGFVQPHFSQVDRPDPSVRSSAPS